MIHGVSRRGLPLTVVTKCKIKIGQNTHKGRDLARMRTLSLAWRGITQRGGEAAPRARGFSETPNQKMRLLPLAASQTLLSTP